MSSNKKKYEKVVKNSCKWISKNSKTRRKCIELSQCTFNKCNNELDEYQSSIITDKENAQCKKNKSYDYYSKCIEDLMDKKDFYNKQANLNFCNANKCPQISEFINEQINLNRLSKQDYCDKTQCNKEIIELNNANKEFESNHFKCEKQYKTHNEQKKCFNKIPNFKKLQNSIKK